MAEVTSIVRPRESERWFLRALALDTRKESWPIARGLYLEVLRHEPGHYEALNNLGALELRMGRSREAYRRLERARALDPWRGEAWNNLGYYHQAMGDKVRALACYRRSLACEPSESTHFNYARALEASGKPAAAAAAWRGYLARYGRRVPDDIAELARALCGRCAAKAKAVIASRAAVSHAVPGSRAAQAAGEQ